ncbi:MAG TPA: DUF502 domain-containing protein [Firmicutes bacterium]|nr:MAG: hypothetical protein DRP67_00250 [Candidatus Omnitrophota bacterium]HDD65012.1 DUF502 domain-containing protein [Bacillota bacterium]
MKNLKRYFISGLIFIIPVSLSIWILFKITIFLEGIVGGFLKKYIPGIYTPGIGLISLILLILIVGILAHNFVGRRILYFTEKFLTLIPFFNKIYIFIKGIVQNIFEERKKVFKEAVEVEFIPGFYTVGFVTDERESPDGKKLLSIFVPTVPNISTGFYVIVPEEKVKRLDMSIEDALKYVISMGIFKVKNGGNKN